MAKKQTETANLMRIGDLARRAGTTMRTIRYYEERGLLSPSARTKGGFRLYDEGELKRLHLIRSMQRLDIPLAQVKALFEERSQGRPAAEIAPKLSRALQAQLVTLEGKIQRCQAIQESVQRSLEILRACAECSRVPGPESCGSCPAVAAQGCVPLHLRAIIDTA
jgi:DNA-binding transcriptional MerR regulator